MKKFLSVLLGLFLFLTSCGFQSMSSETSEIEKAESEKTETEYSETESGNINEQYNNSLLVPQTYDQVYEQLSSIRNLRSNYNTDFYATASDDMVFDVEESVDLPAVAESAVPKESSAAFSNDYSKTNVQVEGIDEGDVIKTDGRYIYILKEGCDLLILSADGKETQKLSQTRVAVNQENDQYKSNDSEGNYWLAYHYQYAQDLYVDNGLIAIVLQDYSYHEEYINNIWNYDNNTHTSLELYDISNPYQPVKIASFGQDGEYCDSRLMSGNVYMISRYYIYDYETDSKNYDSFIPHLYIEEDKTLIPVDDIIIPQEPDNYCYTVISRYSLADCKRASTKTILGTGDTIYMNGDHLYIAGSEYFNEMTEETFESVYSVSHYISGNRIKIFKVDIADDIYVEAVGTTDGYLLNQFSLDEYNGFLRVVTTVSRNSYHVYEDKEYGFSNYRYDNNVDYNELTIFDENLNVAGRISNLAEDERVYSVRFSGDVGYFVTFRQMDPLFSVDLSDPYDPRIMSELKIPGFSNYLHPYSDSLLFGLGQNADEDHGWTTGMKLSMFDVGDPYNVIEKDKLLLDEQYSTALYNHKAILVVPEKDLIGFPADNGYVLYTYSDENGFKLINKIEFSDDYWWYGNTRGLYINKNIYIVNEYKTIVLDMDSYEILARLSY